MSMNKVAHPYLIGYRTILAKEVRRFMRIWPQTILPPAITTALYFVIFGKLIGSRIGPVAGFGYIDYIVPGLILMAVISHSYANVVSSFYSTKFQRHIEELLIAPLPSWIILAGYVSGGVARGLVVGVVVTLVSACFVELSVFHWPLVIAVVFLTAILFAMAGFINAVFARTFDDISIIPTFVLTPLIYLGGVFYSVDMLPPFWQGVSLFNPMLYMVNALRYGMLGVSDIESSSALVIIIVFIGLLGAAALWLLHKGVGIKS